MTTDDLIRSLAADVPPVSRHAVGRRLAAGIVVGGLITLAAIALLLGFRPNFRSAVHGFSFWMKAAYTLSMAIAAGVIVARLARPGRPLGRTPWLLAVPVLLLAIVGAIEMAHAPRSHWLAMWLGATWRICPWLVLLLSIPIFVGLLWSFRRLAATRLRLAGAASGLCAGASAAVIYCLHCPEVSAIFVLTWYTLGMALAAAAGAVLGPRLMRW